jgi:hypothetical protein
MKGMADRLRKSHAGFVGDVKETFIRCGETWTEQIRSGLIKQHIRCESALTDRSDIRRVVGGNSARDQRMIAAISRHN